MRGPNKILGVCEICGRNATHRDHDHATDRIRGLLCASCNHVAGLLVDNPEFADKMAAYLRKPAMGESYSEDRHTRLVAHSKARYTRERINIAATHALNPWKYRQRDAISRMRRAMGLI